MSWFLGYCARIAFVAVLGLIGIWCAEHRAEAFGKKAFLVYYAVRLVGMYILVSIMGNIPSDVTGWLMHAHWMVDDGLFPGKGFLTPYALGFNFLIASAVKCFDAPFAIIVLFTFAEIIAVGIIYDAFSRMSGVLCAKQVVILFLSSPVTIYCLCLGAQDETLMLLAIACTFWAIVVGWDLLALIGIAFGGFFFTKILTLFFLQPFYFCRKFKSVFLCVVGFVGYVGLAKAIGVDPFNLVFGRSAGLTGQGEDLSALYTLGNVWFLFKSVSPLVQNAFFLFFLVLLSVVPLLKLLRLPNEQEEKKSLEICINLLCRWGIAFTMFYRMSFATYCACFLPFLLYIVVRRGGKYHFDAALLLSWLLVLSAKDSLFCGRHALGLCENTLQLIFGIYTLVYLVLSMLIVFRFLLAKNDIWFWRGNIAR